MKKDQTKRAALKKLAFSAAAIPLIGSKAKK